MGSDNNNNNNSYYNSDQNMSTSPYYQPLSSQNSSSQGSIVKSVNNEWISSEETNATQDIDNEAHCDQNMRNSNSDSSNSRSLKSYNLSTSQQHLQQMSAPQWNFPCSLGNSSYQRFYGDSHYGIVLSPNVSLMSTPSSSMHSVNSDVSPQAHGHYVHQMQTSQQLKKIFYQGLTSFTLV